MKERGHYPLAVNGHNDHIHILFDYSLLELIPGLVREIKKSSTNYIKREGFTRNKFQWQNGYGVFAVGWKEKKQMLEYITNQEKHHAKRSFKEEYLSLLKKFDIEYKDEYVFDFL